MKSLLFSSLLKAILPIASLVWCFGCSTVAQAGVKDPLSFDPVKPGNWNYRTESPLGYLKVYSATAEFKESDAVYFPDSSYAIYTIDGKLLRNVKNHDAPKGEIPPTLALPIGTYTVQARSKKRGFMCALVVIKEAQQTILHFDVWETLSAGLANN